ncbi:putative cobyric acid synthase protein [Halorhabdus tiamatea SARL4B]|nr:cobyric acid synthase [Halorhabdus tiamatea]ERJ06591.1 putative cobyric acid synthase protein [Halorhabdus tiamatea SARL4B]
MTGDTIFVSGTGFGTGVGKSFVTSLLCRLLDDEGYEVAPFKTLNLTPVTYTKNGAEFGYAQALQAVAARTDPDPRMNPFTPKPNEDGTIDLVFGDETVEENVDIVAGFRGEDATLADPDHHEAVLDTADTALSELRAENDIVVIEGSGPAQLVGFGPISEWFDLANMQTAAMADAATFLVTDNLDAVPGTLSDLEPEHRDLVEGVVLDIPELAQDLVNIGIDQDLLLAAGGAQIREQHGDEMPIVATLPKYPQLADLPDLDPLTLGPKISFEQWEVTIDSIATEAAPYVDLAEIVQKAE